MEAYMTGKTSLYTQRNEFNNTRNIQRNKKEENLLKHKLTQAKKIIILLLAIPMVLEMKLA
jgi:hypothetical protein